MAKITMYVCDYCDGDFDAAPSPRERFILSGNRYSDAAGSMDNSRPVLEMHESCWRRFAKACGEKENDKPV